MKYRIRDGVICRKICDEYFLITTGESLGVCPGIQQLNRGAAYYWKLLMHEPDLEKILEKAARESGHDVETLRPGAERFFGSLVEQKYLIPET